MNVNKRFALSMIPIVIVLSSIFLIPPRFVEQVWPLISWIYFPGTLILLLLDASTFHSGSNVAIFVANLIFYTLLAYAVIAGIAALKKRH
jgi:hypothetical protein